MHNIITAFIEFYFKGEKFTPAITLELDSYMQSTNCLPDLYGLIANENNIDLYSYEYEMMLAENIRISRAEGLVADYVNNGMLDTEAFEHAWREQQVRMAIQQVVEQYGLSAIVQQHPALADALLDVYKAGQAKHRQK